MSGKCRPSLRPKTLYNVDRSSLSTTDKECIRAVFELADHQKAEIEKNEKIIKAANDLIETQKAEIERLQTELDKEVKRRSIQADRLRAERSEKYTQAEMLCKLRTDLSKAKSEAIKEFAEKVKANRQKFLFSVTAFDKQIDNLVKEMVGDTE